MTAAVLPHHSPSGSATGIVEAARKTFFLERIRRGSGDPRYSRPGGRRYSFIRSGSVTPVADYCQRLWADHSSICGSQRLRGTVESLRQDY